jgi:GNAT superfamily N-acetyltransferase
MLIRPVRGEDTASLRRTCFSANTAEQMESIVHAALDQQERGETVWLVAIQDDGEVAGTCTVTRLQHRMCRHRADIGGFVVVPDARGTGLARKLIDKATRHARNWGCSILEISCRGGTHAEMAYLGLGFAEWGRLRGGYHDHGDQIFDEVRLWMPISSD